MALHRPHPLRFWWLALLLLLFFCLLPNSLAARTLNGFELSDSLLDVNQIRPGGPPRDGIPAIDQPLFEPAERAAWLRPESRVLGVVHNGIAKAYPIAILNWHEIVNDRFAGDGVVITYCPLCGSGVAYRAEVDGRQLTFGVSGLLYNSDVLLYDRQSESLWSQLRHQAISGAMRARRLRLLPATHTTWADWRQRNPDTRVLSRRTGYIRDYNRNPYGDYEHSPLLYFGVEFMSRAYHPKERVLGVELNGRFKAYPFAELAKLGLSGDIQDTLGEQLLQIEYDAVSRTGRVWLVFGEELAAINLYWFAWYAFHPQTEVFTVNRDLPADPAAEAAETQY